MIDKNILKQARNTDMIAFLERYCGFTFTHTSDAYRCQQHNSLAVKNDRLSWYWHSKSIGGHGALDYLVKVENMPFRQAVEAVTGIGTSTAPPQQETEKPKILVLPEKSNVMLRLYDYLCIKRGINSKVINSLIQEEKLYEDNRGNVVFVGHDENGKARFASLRGTQSNYRGDCTGSDKRYGFNMTASEPSDRLYIFESPIDAMSHASLELADTGKWRPYSRLSLAGTSETALPFFLNQHINLKELVFCLDNDHAGREASVAMKRKYADKGYYTRIELPEGKDFNEDLQVRVKQIQEEKHASFLHIDVEK